MNKTLNITIIAVLLILGVFSYCRSAEELKITTYYPSPYGSYANLTVANYLTLPGQPAFVARYSGSISAPNYMVWGTAETNIGSHYSTSTGLFSAPKAGMYIFGFNILLPYAGTGEYRFDFRKNGALYNCIIEQKPTASTWITIQGTTAAYLNAGDTMGVYYSVGSGAAYNDANYNRFWGYFLG